MVQAGDSRELGETKLPLCFSPAISPSFPLLVSLTVISGTMLRSVFKMPPRRFRSQHIKGRGGSPPTPGPCSSECCSYPSKNGSEIWGMETVHTSNPIIPPIIPLPIHHWLYRQGARHGGTTTSAYIGSKSVKTYFSFWLVSACAFAGISRNIFYCLKQRCYIRPNYDFHFLNKTDVQLAQGFNGFSGIFYPASSVPRWAQNLGLAVISSILLNKSCFDGC